MRWGNSLDDGEMSVRLFVYHAGTGVPYFSSFSKMWGNLVDIISTWATDLFASHDASQRMEKAERRGQCDVNVVTTCSSPIVSNSEIFLFNRYEGSPVIIKREMRTAHLPSSKEVGTGKAEWAMTWNVSSHRACSPASSALLSGFSWICASYLRRTDQYTSNFGTGWYGLSFEKEQKTLKQKGGKERVPDNSQASSAPLVVEFPVSVLPPVPMPPLPTC